ncbi:MAG: hypothetical protein Q4E75_01635 [bacterium]|nr:hypothetical protein [bacterium]
MKNYIQLLAIEKLEGGNYNVDTVLNAIKQVTDWALKVGIALAGVSLVIGFVVYSVVDVDQKPRAKQRIIQTLLGIGGIVLAISLVNIVIGLFK